MCFLKGKTTAKHSLGHKMFEISHSSKTPGSWRHKLFQHNTQEGRLWDEPRSPFAFTCVSRRLRFNIELCLLERHYDSHVCPFFLFQSWKCEKRDDFSSECHCCHVGSLGPSLVSHFDASIATPVEIILILTACW